MKRLILMRHAKSDWSGPNEPDHERPLNRRGRVAAPLMGAWLADCAEQGGWRIDAAMISDSARTQESWARLEPLLERAPAPIVEKELYLAEPDAIMAAVHRAPETAETVLILGHNPGIETFAMQLGEKTDKKPGPFPTAATAIFEANGTARKLRWADVRPGDFRLAEFETPKTLV